MPHLNAYLFFNGNCAEAMRHYADVFGGKADIMPVAGSPAAAHMPPGSENLVLHSRLEFDGNELMASDEMEGGYAGMKHFSLALGYDDENDARRVFERLSEGGNVIMPFNETFFAKGFGQVVDRFGTPWMVTGGMKQP